MKRETGIARLQHEEFDVLIIGGGATGLGCAVDAASRGYRTALIETGDFAGATSSRSTKLVHGGVRYLQQGNIGLVREALLERSRLLRNAPGLVHPLAFVLPTGNWRERFYYGTGLRLYDILARESNVRRSCAIRAAEAAQSFPALRSTGLSGALVYWDAHFDDARLAVALAQTAVNQGAAIANYVCAGNLLYRDSRISGVTAVDRERNETFEIRARAVINATGIFADELRSRDRPGAENLLAFSRGSHLVISREALPIRQTALLVPKTSDGRVLFAVPWHGHALVGTTDVAAYAAEMDPQPSFEEIEFLLAAINRYVTRPLRRSDVRSAFAGLRPLVNRGAIKTSRLSREHIIDVSPSRLITITGGKWTTYRKMAQDAVDCARDLAQLPPSPCRTCDLRLHDVPPMPELEHAVEREMARTLTDLLGRRRRTLFVDAAAAGAEATSAVEILARALGRDEGWKRLQLQTFDEVVRRYGAP